MVETNWPADWWIVAEALVHGWVVVIDVDRAGHRGHHHRLVGHLVVRHLCHGHVSVRVRRVVRVRHVHPVRRCVTLHAATAAWGHLRAMLLWVHRSCRLRWTLVVKTEALLLKAARVIRRSGVACFCNSLNVLHVVTLIRVFLELSSLYCRRL